ncbi:MAG TPA: MauE/DoxX family redox-associated membrane protein [Thermoanaerobaculia bacterium]|nr:MauE/DoxX family redox-associated membrane protein [Thermoanaerobaculia bacterium]
MTVDAARLVVQLTLGLVFLLSAAGKLRRPAAFLRGVAEFEILPAPLAYAFGAFLIPVEGFLAVAHLTGWGLGVAAPLGVVTLLAFAAGVGINLRRNRDLLCHCFDSLRGERVSARSLAQIVLLMAGELLVLSEAPFGALHRPVIPDRVATLEDLAFAMTWAVFCLLASLWILRVDEVVALFRTPHCKTCSRTPAGEPASS